MVFMVRHKNAAAASEPLPPRSSGGKLPNTIPPAYVQYYKLVTQVFTKLVGGVVCVRVYMSTQTQMEY